MPGILSRAAGVGSDLLHWALGLEKSLPATPYRPLTRASPSYVTTERGAGPRTRGPEVRAFESATVAPAKTAPPRTWFGSNRGPRILSYGAPSGWDVRNPSPRARLSDLRGIKAVFLRDFPTRQPQLPVHDTTGGGPVYSPPGSGATYSHPKQRGRPVSPSTGKVIITPPPPGSVPTPWYGKRTPLSLGWGVGLTAAAAGVGGMTSYATGGSFWQGAIFGGVMGAGIGIGARPLLGGVLNKAENRAGLYKFNKFVHENTGFSINTSETMKFLGTPGGRATMFGSGALLGGFMFGGNKSHKRGFNAHRGNSIGR